MVNSGVHLIAVLFLYGIEPGLYGLGRDPQSLCNLAVREPLNLTFQDEAFLAG